MPSYDYRCRSCKEVFTELNSISDRNIPCSEPCKKCGGEVHIAILSAPRTVSSVTVTDKRPKGWRDVLGNIKRAAGRTSTMDV